MGGCGSSHAVGYGDTPYSKKISKNLVRFWAEVFLLGQGGSGAGKWELLVPKLVPVNVARVADSPSFITHVTAYNTKVDKIVDALLSYPEMSVYRGSPCFVYWADAGRALTLGLNFLTPQDADAFTLLVCGQSGQAGLSRRANSAADLVSKKEVRPRSTSLAEGWAVEGEAKRQVKFANPPVSKSVETTPVGGRRVLSPDTASEADQPPDPFTLYMTGKRLSDWTTMLPADAQSPAPQDIQPSLKPPRAVIPVPPPSLRDEELGGSATDVLGAPSALRQRALMNRSLDPGTLQRMLSPLKGAQSSSASFLLSAEPGQSFGAGRGHGGDSSSASSAQELRLRRPERARRERPESASTSAAAAPESLSLSSSLSSPHTSARGSPAPSADPSPRKLTKMSFLFIRRWLEKQENGICLADGQGWQRYWVVLRGMELRLFLAPEGSSPEPERGGAEEALDLLNCLVTALPEYPKRQNILCLSLGSGRALLLQTGSGAEAEAWTRLLHSAAALALARTTSVEVAHRTLRKETDKIAAKTATVRKMIRLSELPSVGTVSVRALGDWEEELELLELQAHCARAYLAALSRSLPPAPTPALAAASLSTKAFLSDLGAFTVSSLHALVFARSHGSQRPSVSTPTPTPSLHSVCAPSTSRPDSASEPPLLSDQPPRVSTVTLPNGQVIRVAVTERETVKEVLRKICVRVPLEAKSHFILLRRTREPSECLIPSETELLWPLLWEWGVELRERLVYHVDLGRESLEVPLGLTVRAVRQGGEGRAAVTAVSPASQASRKGLQPGDLLLRINGHPVSGLSSAQVERLLQQPSGLCLVVSSARPALPPSLQPLPHQRLPGACPATAHTASAQQQRPSPPSSSGSSAHLRLRQFTFLKQSKQSRLGLANIQALLRRKKGVHREANFKLF